VELRLRISYRTTQQAGNFMMFVAFHFMQNEDLAAAFWQFLDGAIEIDPVHDADEVQIISANIARHKRRLHLYWLIERNLPQLALAKLHQDCVDRNPIKPGGKTGVSAEGTQLAEDLDESVLRQIFSFDHLPGHTRTQGVDPSFVQIEEGRERFIVSLLGARDELGFRIHAGLVLF